MKKLNKYLFSIILALLLLPGIQTIFRFVKEKPLEGISVEQQFPNFTFQDWFSLDYQPKLNKYFVHHFGFRPFLTRLYNQIDFMVFKKANGHGVVVGKNDYLFEKWFIDEYLGSIPPNKSKISNNLQKLTEIREYLKNYNTELLVLMAPGKPYIYPEYIPTYLQKEKKTSIYETYSHKFHESKIPFIDLNKWFVELKDTVPYPLFPKTGTHWSYFGVGLAIDSIISKVEKACDTKMDHIHISDYKLVSPDNDLERIMNLFTTIPNDSIAYPVVKINRELNITKPKVIIIGDSYFWVLEKLKFTHVFGGVHFWYYFKTVFPDINGYHEKVEEIDVFSRIASSDIVILLQSTSSLDDLGWGFIDKLSDSIENNPPSYETIKIKQIIEKIQSNPKWLNLINDKAIKRNISLDSMLYLDAKYLYDKI